MPNLHALITVALALSMAPPVAHPRPIVVYATIRAPIESVWQAITNRDRMVKWFFAEIPSFAPRVGSETRFSVKAGDKTFVHLWKVTDAAKPTRLSYAWSYEGYPGMSQVTWTLTPVRRGTRMKLIHAGGETFPQNIPEFQRPSGEAGWNHFIRERLKKYLESN